MTAANPTRGQRPWNYAPHAFPPKLQKEKGTTLLFVAGKEDFQRVAQWYQQHPVQGMGIRTVKIIHNSLLEKAFESRIALLEERSGVITFKPKWEIECKDKAEKRQRQEAMSLFRCHDHTS